jgi:hypothetical protein
MLRGSANRQSISSNYGANGWLERRWPSRGVPEVENFDAFSLLVNTVVDVNGRMKKSPDGWFVLYRGPEIRKCGQQVKAAEEVIT